MLREDKLKQGAAEVVGEWGLGQQEQPEAERGPRVSIAELWSAPTGTNDSEIRGGKALEGPAVPVCLGCRTCSFKTDSSGQIGRTDHSRRQ